MIAEYISPSKTQEDQEIDDLLNIEEEDDEEELELDQTQLPDMHEPRVDYTSSHSKLQQKTPNQTSTSTKNLNQQIQLDSQESDLREHPHKNQFNLSNKQVLQKDQGIDTNTSLSESNENVSQQSRSQVAHDDLHHTNVHNLEDGEKPKSLGETSPETDNLNKDVLEEPTIEKDKQKIEADAKPVVKPNKKLMKKLSLR